MRNEDHIAVLHALWREEHEEEIADLRRMADEAQADGRLSTAQIFQEAVAQFEAMEKPWEQKRTQA